MAELKYWLWLTGRKGIEGQIQMGLLHWFGSPEAIYFAEEAELRALGVREKGISSLKDKSMEEADRILGECDRLGIHIMTMQDARYPERLRAIAQPPSVLYWKGREISFDDEAAVALVGSRDATPYGMYMARQLAMDLTRSGALVVSGMAQGIDGAALRGGLTAGGPVVSVLANGLDVIYPSRHRELYEDVAAAGVLLSEYPPGTHPIGRNFPVRNRIISGLSAGVVLVESRESGGGLITARTALDQDREVFAVPGPADGVMSRGTNRLIQAGEAKLILSAEDVLCEFTDRFPGKLKKRPPMTEEEREQRLETCDESTRKVPAAGNQKENARENSLDNPPNTAYIDWQDIQKVLNGEQRTVLITLQEGAASIDELSERTQLEVKKVLSALMVLQIRGMAVEEGGNRFRSAVRLKME